MERYGQELLTNLRLGDIRDPEDERDFSYNASLNLNTDNSEIITAASTSLPSKVDYRYEMSPVKYQGALGSCVAFSVAAVKEWQEQQEYEKAIKEGSTYRREEEGYNLSEEWLYWNCKKIDPWGPSVEGTNIRSALKVLNKIGIPPEKAWPYTDKKIDIGEPKKWAYLISRWYTIGSYWRLNNLDEIKHALSDCGPVVVGIACYSEMFGALKKGYVPMPGSNSRLLAYHAICLTGYDDTTKRITFKNSWSKYWGDVGYGYFSYDYANKYIFDAWAIKDVEVTPDMLPGVRELTYSSQGSP